MHGAAAMAAFQRERAELAYTAGSRWRDPDLQPWEGSSGTTAPLTSTPKEENVWVRQAGSAIPDSAGWCGAAG